MSLARDTLTVLGHDESDGCPLLCGRPRKEFGSFIVMDNGFRRMDFQGERTEVVPS